MVTLAAAAGYVVHFFPTGQGNIIGNPILPVIKLTANPRTVRTMSEHIDYDCSGLLQREINLDQAGDGLLDVMFRTINGRLTDAEALGHREFVLTKLYRSNASTLTPDAWYSRFYDSHPNASERIAATRSANGTDVNFGALTNQLLQFLSTQGGVTISYSQKVTDLSRSAQGWTAQVKNTKSGEQREIHARFVFLGAGGGALPLLQMSGIPEGKGFGGFPVSGQWLRCDNPEVVKQHQAKVYSQAEVGAPPMSVPHLDTRVVDGKTSLLFGPYAGFTTKFLKYGSFLDLPLSVRPSNIGPMLAVARDNFDLTRYLIKEVLQSPEQRLDALRKFYPNLNPADWRLEIAGQRVQIIKKDAKKGGILQFGTELVAAEDGSIAALLGASPGASVTVSIMLNLIERCFADKAKGEWAAKLKEIFPAREKVLEEDAALYREVAEQTSKALQLA